MQIPSNLFLNKLGTPGLYLPTAMIIWGAISTATAACQNYIGLLMCRFFLGFVEAAYFVSFLPCDLLCFANSNAPSPDVFTISHVGIPEKN